MTETGGWITLIFDHDGTAVSLRAHGVDEEQVVAFVATLVPRPWGETAALPGGTSPTQTPAEEPPPDGAVPVPAGCDVSLELVEEGSTTPTSSSPVTPTPHPRPPRRAGEATSPMPPVKPLAASGPFQWGSFTGSSSAASNTWGEEPRALAIAGPSLPAETRKEGMSAMRRPRIESRVVVDG
jgi:hypothetical protein